MDINQLKELIDVLIIPVLKSYIDTSVEKKFNVKLKDEVGRVLVNAGLKIQKEE
jgi:hypothetical protein